MAGSRIGSVVGTFALAGALTLTLVAPMAPDGAAQAGADPTVVSGLGEPRYTMPLEGEVVTPFDEPDAPWGAGHRGVDIAAAVGAIVHAADDGVVAFVGVVVDRPVISIDHPDGIRTTYEPVTATVEAGDAVVQGQPIGTLAGEGSHCAPAACLHWGARIGDDYLDPLSLLSEPVIRLYPTTSADHEERTVRAPERAVTAGVRLRTAPRARSPAALVAKRMARLAGQARGWAWVNAARSRSELMWV